MRLFRSAHVISGALAALMMTMVPHVQTAAFAADSSDIPGLPLPSRTLAGEVGGATVDYVYQLDVEQGTSLLLTLRGEYGAELGLYVFGEDATSVLTSTPIMSSAKPGSNQTISLLFFEAARIFINVNGRNEDRPYRFQLTSSVIVDRTAPIIKMAAADRLGTGQRICARIEAIDPVSGIQSVAISVSGSDTPLAWRAYRGLGRYCADLGLKEGRYPIEIHARNNLGMASAAYAGMIAVDNQAPTVLQRLPKSEVLLESRGTIAYRFSEPVWFVGPRSSRVIVMTQRGAMLDGTIQISPDRMRVRWVPVRAVPIGTVIVATLGQVRDEAGNVATSIDPMIVTRKHRTRLQLEVTRVGPRRVYLRIVGSTNLVGESVVLYARSGRSWVPKDSVVIAFGGTTISLPKESWSQFRVEWQGSELLNSSAASSPTFD